MATNIPENFKDLFVKPTFAHLATVMRDGRPQVTPVWIDFDGTHILVNSATGRIKDRNLRRDKRVALSILDPDNPYRYLSISGEVVEITQAGANDHIDTLAKRYLRKDKYPYHRPGEARVIFKIRPDKVSTHG